MLQTLYIYYTNGAGTPIRHVYSDPLFDGTILPPIVREKTHTLTHTPLFRYNFGRELHYGGKNCGVVWDGAVKFWGFVICWGISGGLTGML